VAGVALSSGRLTSGEYFFSGYTPSASVTIQVTRALRTTHPASDAGQLVIPDYSGQWVARLPRPQAELAQGVSDAQEPRLPHPGCRHRSLREPTDDVADGAFS
jgi:hypothetical protein